MKLGYYRILTPPSLPAGIDHNELNRMLTDHLSEYPEVKSVKVVRDSKGGVCAFMQCEVITGSKSVDSTAQRIYTLHRTRTPLAVF